MFITAAINGFEDIIAITSLVGMAIVSIILLMGSKPVYSFLIKFWMRTRFTAPLKIGVLSGYLEETKKVKEFRSAYRSKSEEFMLIPLLKTAHKIPTRKEFKKKTLDFDCYPIAAVKYGYGYLLLNGFKLEKSRPEDFQKIVESEGELFKADAYFNLGRMYEAVSNPEKAREAYDKLVNDYPESANVRMAKEKISSLDRLLTKSH